MTAKAKFKKRMKASPSWRKANGYEAQNRAHCLCCAFFKIDANMPIHGKCRLMDREGIYDGVMTDAVCNRFISRHGTDIDGKRLDPDALSAFFEFERLKNGDVYIKYGGAK